MFNKKDIIIISSICLVLGFIVVRQFYLQQKVNKVSQPEEGNAIAMEVAELIKNNDELQAEIDDLTGQKDILFSSAANQQAANETIEKNLDKYRIILGQTKVEGTGVEIIFDDKVDSTQIIDLINALKNIGAEAIAINHQRLNQKSSVEDGIFYPPSRVEAIGDANVLEEALKRKGGIVEQIGTGTVQKHDRIILPAL